METEDGHPSLKRQLGLLKATCYITGGIVGVGIFIGPATILKGSGSSVGVSLVIWIISGFLMYCGAMTYAEYGSRVPKSGGTYTYIREAFGDLLGFVFLWTQLVLVRPMGVLLGCLASAEYIIRPLFLDCSDVAVKDAKILLGLTILLLMTAINCYSVNYGAYFQALSTFCKVSALIIIIIGGFIHLAKGGSGLLSDGGVLFEFVGFLHVMSGNDENFEKAWETNSDLTPIGLSLTVYVCFYAYMGWDNVSVATEEVTRPKRNIPLAILLGLTIATVVYLSANVAYHAALTNAEIMSGAAVAVLFGERILGPIKWIILPCIGISAAGIANTIIFTSSRIHFTGGRDGLFPEFFSMVNVKRRTPMPSVIILCVLAVIYMCFGDLVSILGAYSFLRAGGEVVAIFGIFNIRRKYPATKQTFVSPTVFPVLYMVVSAVLACVAVFSNPKNFLPGMIVTLIGVPVYYLSKTRWWKTGPLTRVHYKISFLFKSLFLCETATKAINKE